MCDAALQFHEIIKFGHILRILKLFCLLKRVETMLETSLSL